MTNVLILGAYGQIARAATLLFMLQPDVHLTLFLRDARRLKTLEQAPRVRVVEGDVLDQKALEAVMPGHDVVYANLSGPMERQARNIVGAMEKTGLRRLIFISSMGIYDEIPGERHGSILDPYRNSVRVIEASDLDYTIIRPAWLNDRDEIAYGTTRKGEPFKNASAVVSRKSVASLVVKLATTPGLEIRQSLGVHKEP
ncbi:MAG TPA: NAD(P)H-binding protein [Holophaga sp.]|nr:NAD(P)H-binding protein [Holophaga sp.]